MEHVVFFPAHDGSPAFRRVASLQDAVRLVEHLRNIEGVNEVSVHSLEEVPMAFKPYYRVEIPGVEEPAAAAPLPPRPPSPRPPRRRRRSRCPRWSRSPSRSPSWPPYRACRR